MVGIAAFSGKPLKCIFLNKLGREIINFSAGTSISEVTVERFFPTSIKGNLRVFSQEILDFEGFTQDLVLSKLNGTNFMANVGIKHIEVNGEKDILVMFQDTTYQKKLQKEIALKQNEINKAYEDLLLQNKQLKELDLAKNSFMALTTHELRTPVAAIVATTDVLVNKLYDDDIERDEFISTLHEQGNQLLELINDILDFAKIQAGKMEYYVEHSNVYEVLKEQVSHFELMGTKSHVTLTLNASPNKVRKCYFDKLRLSQVIGNILNNAIKFNRKNGTVTISVEENENKAFTVVNIADTGRGIDKADLEKVFNEFETIVDVSQHHKGTGLGMPISKRIIESMGGSLSLESTVGVGTTFKIHIPNNKVLAAEVYRTRPDMSDDLVA